LGGGARSPTCRKRLSWKQNNSNFVRFSFAEFVSGFVWFEGVEIVTADKDWGVCRSRLRLKCDGTRAETRFRLSAKRAGPFKSASASVQSTTGSRSVRISGSNAGYTMFRGSVKGTGYLLSSPVFPPLTVPRVTVCHHVSSGP
jgi:hypothetical protein